ncbi:hypothetical protein DFH27DRAFT_549648 [Peziza echinospora]|nr:hypothetical protein DFH27DRAFT_549648 [Peziza echinospora]
MPVWRVGRSSVLRRVLLDPGYYGTQSRVCYFSSTKLGKLNTEEGSTGVIIMGEGFKGMNGLPKLKEDSVPGRLLKVEAEIGTLTKLCEHMDGYIKWVFTFGLGTVLLGVGGAIFKLYHYDVTQTNELKGYVKETVGSSEKVLESKIESLRASFESDMKAMKSELLSEIRAMRR